MHTKVNKLKYMTHLAVVLILTGCTTLGDFKKMTPQERANTVCSRQKDIKQSISQIVYLQESILDNQIDLDRGYKIHKQCQQVEVFGEPTVTCNNFGYGVTCNQTRPKSYKTVCTETPIPIDSNLVRQNIANWQSSINTIKMQAAEKKRICLEKVNNLTPEEAYKLY